MHKALFTEWKQDGDDLKLVHLAGDGAARFLIGNLANLSHGCAQRVAARGYVGKRVANGAVHGPPSPPGS